VEAHYRAAGQRTLGAEEFLTAFFMPSDDDEDDEEEDGEEGDDEEADGEQQATAQQPAGKA